MEQVDAIVFLVDAADRERLIESKKELDGLLADDSLGDVPFLVLGNKIDLPNACSEDDLRHYLGLTGMTTGKGKVNLKESNIRPIEIFMCSVVCHLPDLFWCLCLSSACSCIPFSFSTSLLCV